MKRAGWRKRSRRRLMLPPTPAETAAAGLLLLFLERALGVPMVKVQPESPPERKLRDLGRAEVVE